MTTNQPNQQALLIMTDELIATLREAQHEIQSLRRRNEILAAKVEVMDSFVQVMHTRPAEHAPDIVFEIEKHIEKHIAKLEDAKKPQTA